MSTRVKATRLNWDVHLWFGASRSIDFHTLLEADTAARAISKAAILARRKGGEDLGAPTRAEARLQ